MPLTFVTSDCIGPAIDLCMYIHLNSGEQRSMVQLRRTISEDIFLIRFLFYV